MNSTIIDKDNLIITSGSIIYQIYIPDIKNFSRKTNHPSFVSYYEFEIVDKNQKTTFQHIYCPLFEDDIYRKLLNLIQTNQSSENHKTLSESDSWRNTKIVGDWLLIGGGVDGLVEISKIVYYKRCQNDKIIERDSLVDYEFTLSINGLTRVCFTCPAFELKVIEQLATKLTKN